MYIYIYIQESNHIHIDFAMYLQYLLGVICPKAVSIDERDP